MSLRKAKKIYKLMKELDVLEDDYKSIKSAHKDAYRITLSWERVSKHGRNISGDVDIIDDPDCEIPLNDIHQNKATCGKKVLSVAKDWYKNRIIEVKNKIEALTGTD